MYPEMRLQKIFGPIVQDKTRTQAWGINFEQLGFVPMYLFLEVQLTPFESVGANYSTTHVFSDITLKYSDRP